MSLNDKQLGLHQASPPSADPGEWRVTSISSTDQLLPHAAAWNRITLSLEHGSPYLTFEWMYAWLETMAVPGDRWVCLLAHRGKELCGVLPLVSHPYRILSLERPRLGVPRDVHTPSVDIIASPDRFVEASTRLLAAARLVEPRMYNFSVCRIPDNSPTFTHSDDLFDGFKTVTESIDRGAYIPINRTFKEYTAALSPNFERNLRRVSRKFDDASGIAKFVLATPETNGPLLTQFLQLESAGWKGKAGGAILADQKVTSFYRLATGRLAHSGLLEWHMLQLEGALVAAHLAVRVGGVLNLLKICYDETRSAYAPGNLLMARMIEREFESGSCREINFLSANPWTRNWRAEQRTYHTITAYPKNPISLLRGYVPRRLRLRGRRIHWLMEIYHRLAGSAENGHARQRVAGREDSPEKPSTSSTERRPNE